MANAETLHDLMLDELKDIYDAERQLTKALPKMMKKASSDELRQALEDHLQQTEQHVERLEQVFEQLGETAKAKKCIGMRNLIAEGDEMIKEAEDDDARDAVMIASAQKVEHYEIASYGTLRTWANQMGHTDVAEILETTLEEEKEADQKLTQIAESAVNREAMEGDQEEEEARPSRGRRQTVARSRGRAAAADRSRRR